MAVKGIVFNKTEAKKITGIKLKSGGMCCPCDTNDGRYVMTENDCDDNRKAFEKAGFFDKKLEMEKDIEPILEIKGI